MPKEYDIPLILTTPHMAGVAVRDAQWLLAGHNRFEGLAPYKDGPIDSEYGPLTAQATKRAKFWLGYPLTACDGTFGQTIYEYLRANHWRPLPPEYRTRRAERLAEAANTPGLKAFKAAEKEIGYKEGPGQNNNKFGVEYGFNWVPWCAIFMSIMFAHTGRSSFRYAAVESIYLDARAERNGLRIVYTPQRGDIVGYSLHGEEFAHTAFFDQWTGGSAFRDLGGNTGPSSISNGGMVMKQLRDRSQVRFWARVG